MLTKDQAINAQNFHAGSCSRTIGPRGGITEKTESWRRNGKTQTWKTRPEEYRIPVKYGLYGYSEITHTTENVHLPEDCPLLKTDKEV